MKNSTIHIQAFALLLVSVIMSIGVGHAHEVKPAVADISVTPELVTVSMNVNLEALITEIGTEHDDTDDSPKAEQYNNLRELSSAELAAELDAYLPQLLSQISLSPVFNSEDSAGEASGDDLQLNLASVDVPDVGDIRLARDTSMVLQAERPPSASAISWSWVQQYGPVILRADSLDASGEAFTQYLQPGLTSDPIALEAGAVQSTGSGFFDYVIIGFEHIIPKGLDHILFVIGLFLLAPRLKPIVLQVSMFTLAHTVTLALGITGVITLSPQIVEPLIALSIAVVCFENLFSHKARKSRLVMVFLFGLLHGLGFAGVLSDIGLPGGRFVSSLLAFNIGVELGQLCVVLACFALVGWWFGNRSWYRNVIVIPASLIIGAVGLFWFLQRSGLN